MMKELNDISKNNPFKVPENYFEEVNKRILSSTIETHSEVKERSLYHRLRPYLAIAASIAILSLLSYSAFYFLKRPETIKGIPQITIDEFSENYLNDIDNLTLEEDAGSIEQNVATINVNSKDIIDYLVLDNIDINAIYEQL